MPIPDCLPGTRTRSSACLRGIILVRASAACVAAWPEDFRKDIPRDDLPTMIIHGGDDRILPMDVTSRRSRAAPTPVSTTDSRRLDSSFGTPPFRRFSMMKVTLLAELTAKPGKEDALAALLIESQRIAVPPRSEPPIPPASTAFQRTTPITMSQSRLAEIGAVS